jgi:hypothetical protein
MEMSDLYQKMYHRRFNNDVEFRKRMYQVLCANFLGPVFTRAQ